jgi:hypothetical protein
MPALIGLVYWSPQYHMVVLHTSPVKEIRTKAHLSARVRRGGGPCISRVATRSSGTASTARAAVRVSGPSSARASLPKGKLPAQRKVTPSRMP